MTARYVPKVGEYGLFVFSDGVTVPADISYTVDTIAGARELNLMGIDLAAEYTRNGVADLDTDIASNEIMLKLVSKKGKYYLPVRVIKSYPSVDNFRYAQRILGIDLGLIPMDEDLTTLIAKVADTIEKEAGIQPKIKRAMQGGEKWLSATDHDTARAARDNRKDYSPTIGATLQRVNDENAELRQRIALLEELLQASNPPQQ